MKNLTEIATLYKKYSWVFITLTLIIFFSALIFLKNYTTQKTTIPDKTVPPNFETLPGKTKSFNSENLVLPDNPPKKLPVYTLSSFRNLLEKAPAISSSLNFQSKPQNLNDATHGNGLLYSNEKGVIVIYENLLSYQNYQPKTPPKTFDNNLLTTKALSFITNLGLSDNFSKEPRITYSKFEGETITEASSPTNKDLINLKFDYTLDGLRVVGQSSQITTILDSTGNVILFNYILFKYNTKKSEFTLIPPQEALNNLTNNQAFLIDIKDLTGQAEHIKSIGDLGVITLVKAYPAYYLPSNNPDNIQPVWVFEGEGQSSDKIDFIATYAVPAIKESF